MFHLVHLIILTKFNWLMSANNSIFNSPFLLILVLPTGIPGKKTPSLPDVNTVSFSFSVNPSGR